MDRDTTGLTAYEDNTACEIVSFDLEVPNLIDANQTAIDYGPHLPFYERDLACIVVVNYLYRPLLPVLPQALRPGGILIYQTFMRGNEAYGRPRNPEFLLASRELPETFQTDLEEIDFFEGYIESPKPAMIQGYCGRKISGV